MVEPRGGYRRQLVVMAKQPVGGRVKTRLANGIGMAAAVNFHRHAVGTLVGRMAADPRWLTALAVSPDFSVFSKDWPAGTARFGQLRGDLGERMQRIMTRLPPGPVVIIGTDIPRICPGDIQAAFRALGNHDAVFGPAGDGGYWLVGLKRFPRVLRPFGNVRWSSAFAMADTVASLPGKRIAYLRTLEDVDTAEEYARQHNSSGRRITSTP